MSTNIRFRTAHARSLRPAISAIAALAIAGCSLTAANATELARLAPQPTASSHGGELVDGPVPAMPPVSGPPSAATWIALGSKARTSAPFTLEPGAAQSVSLKDLGFSGSFNVACVAISEPNQAQNPASHGTIDLKSSSGDSQTHTFFTPNHSGLSNRFGPGCLNVKPDGTVSVVSHMDKAVTLQLTGSTAIVGKKTDVHRVIDLRHNEGARFLTSPTGGACTYLSAPFNELACAMLNQDAKANGAACLATHSPAIFLIGHYLEAVITCGLIGQTYGPVVKMDPKYSTVYLPGGYVCTRTMTKMACQTEAKQQGFQASQDGSYILVTKGAAKYWTAPKS